MEPQSYAHVQSKHLLYFLFCPNSTILGLYMKMQVYDSCCSMTILLKLLFLFPIADFTSIMKNRVTKLYA